ncbi:uncharacterized protein P884DRAFT_68134 [Thermothelomyces heterothallicus CBS 202.75]|uniref:uncharacterized protein n=1 Tax=Thermothelomyces heterothallicus CBS 202.75 TaxID=1149848 RepID=UPI003744139A
MVAWRPCVVFLVSFVPFSARSRAPEERYPPGVGCFPFKEEQAGSDGGSRMVACLSRKSMGEINELCICLSGDDRCYMSCSFFPSSVVKIANRWLRFGVWTGRTVGYHHFGFGGGGGGEGGWRWLGQFNLLLSPCLTCAIRSSSPLSLFFFLCLFFCLFFTLSLRVLLIEQWTCSGMGWSNVN